MRLGATFISMQMLATAASAETLPDRVVSVFKDVCVTPASSEERMATAEAQAKEGNWKLLVSKPTPVPMMHNENGPKLSYSAIWELPLQEGTKGRLSISILRPEQPGLSYTLCGLQPSMDIDSDDLAQSIDREFGALIEKDESGRFKHERRWFFTEEKAKGNCGRQIEFSLNDVYDRGKPKLLFFNDFAFPKNGQWDPMAALETKCPN